MTREQIKTLLENNGLSVNVRLEGDETHFKITVKSNFLVPKENLTEALVKTRARSHLRGILMYQISKWYNDLS